MHEVNNWNPWINSNSLASVLLLERDPGRRRLHFITPLAADVSTPGRVALARSGGAPVSAGGDAGPVFLYDAGHFTASVEEKAVTDARLQPVWGGRLYRIELTARDRTLRGSHRIVVRAAP